MASSAPEILIRTTTDAAPANRGDHVTMSNTLQFDTGVTERIKAIYSTQDVIRQRSATINALHLQRGQRVLDLGSGPGYLAASIAEGVGATGEVIGLDMSDEMLEVAGRLCTDLPNVRFVSGDVADPPFEEGTFDHVVSTQVLEYVAHVDDCLTHAHRILRTGGQLTIVDTDWDSIVWASSDAARMERILGAWGEHLVDAHLPRTLGHRLRSAGFEVDAIDVIPIVNTTWDAGVYSYGMTHLVADFVAGRRDITPEETKSWMADLDQLSAHGRYFFSINRYLFTATAR
jgi:arsenite methyltransferase